VDKKLFGTQHEVSEWSYRTTQSYADPFNDVELDARINGPGGQTWQVPAYWAGGSEWRVRFAPPVPGEYNITTVCSDAANAELNGQEAHLEAQPYSGANSLLVHGPLRVAATRRTLEHTDGTPFFWLGDTWWMGLCQRLKWPEDFQILTADRVAKGFSLVQIVAGLYPDMPGFDPRGANEAGFPWEAGYARINPAYFDQADLRIGWLVRSGLVPCIVGSWGYYLPQLGLRKIKQHWRNLIARWGAYPVVWCLAGEGAMPYYLSQDKDGDRKSQINGWIEVGRYIRRVDPNHHPLTLHSAQEICDLVQEERLLDVNLIQPAHGGPETLVNSVAQIEREYAHQPVMPALIAEVSYEGILHYSGAEVQRFTFWSALLSGAAGHTYGANGLWQMNTRQIPYGPSPHGATWGNLPWDEAARLPGSGQLGLAKRLLERYEWWGFEPHPDWVKPAGSPAHIEWPFAAGIPGKVRVIYMYGPIWAEANLTVQKIEADAAYTAFFWDPRTGAEYPLGAVHPSADASWVIPIQPELSDWVLVLEQ
jgi:Protein of unknown function (DUF4038)/Domain of unknown function (DUF5060)